MTHGASAPHSGPCNSWPCLVNDTPTEADTNCMETTEPHFIMWQGVECADGLIANGEAQELAHVAKKGKGIRDYASRSQYAARCWKHWASLTREERLHFIAEAYKTYPAGT